MDQQEEAERQKATPVPTAMRMPKGGGRSGYVYDGDIAVAKILEMRTNALVEAGLHDIVGPGTLLPWNLQQKPRGKRRRSPSQTRESSGASRPERNMVSMALALYAERTGQPFQEKPVPGPHQ